MCTSAKKGVRDCVEIPAYIHGKVWKVLRRARRDPDITAPMCHSRARIGNLVTQLRKESGDDLILASYLELSALFPASHEVLWQR